MSNLHSRLLGLVAALAEPLHASVSSLIVATTLLATSPLAALAQNGTGAVTTAPGLGSTSGIDFANAKPMNLPKPGGAPPSLLAVLLSNQAAGADTTPASVFPGKPGNGQLQAQQLAPARAVSASDGVQSQEFGTSSQPLRDCQEFRVWAMG